MWVHMDRKAQPKLEWGADGAQGDNAAHEINDETMSSP